MNLKKNWFGKGWKNIKNDKKNALNRNTSTAVKTSYIKINNNVPTNMKNICKKRFMKILNF